MPALQERLQQVVEDHGQLIEQKNVLLEQVRGLDQQLLVLQGKAIQLQELLAEDIDEVSPDATDDAPTAE